MVKNTKQVQRLIADFNKEIGEVISSIKEAEKVFKQDLTVLKDFGELIAEKAKNFTQAIHREGMIDINTCYGTDATASVNLSCNTGPSQSLSFCISFAKQGDQYYVDCFTDHTAVSEKGHKVADKTICENKKATNRQINKILDEIFTDIFEIKIKPEKDELLERSRNRILDMSHCSHRRFKV